jgi:hypothetical protein
MSKSENIKPQSAERRRWEPPTLQPVGTVGQLIAGGGGKLSLTSQDSGDSRKPSGGG